MSRRLSFPNRPVRPWRDAVFVGVVRNARRVFDELVEIKDMVAADWPLLGAAFLIALAFICALLLVGAAARVL